MKLFTALGSGDIVTAHRAQICGQPTLSETSIIFSGQLLEYCREQGIETLALSCNRRADRLRDGPLTVENRPRGFQGGGGIRYHLSRVAYAVYLARRCWHFGADLAIIDSGITHYFVLALFRLIGTPVAVNFHNVLWPIGFEPKEPAARLIHALDSWFFRWIAVGAVGCSPECGRQARRLAGPNLPFFEYRAQFREAGFDRCRRHNVRNPFHVIFVGRVERNKGVLDIATIAERLSERSSIPVLFDICGDGGALPDLKRIIEGRGLSNFVRIHGRLARPELLKVYEQAHAAIVPTRGDFCEGLPLACAQSVLSGIPIVTSRLSNAIPVLGTALAEAEPENIESYVGAILKLVEDHTYYERLSDACPEVAQQFLDRSKSYPAAIDRLVAHVFPSWKLLTNYDTLFLRVG